MTTHLWCAQGGGTNTPQQMPTSPVTTHTPQKAFRPPSWTCEKDGLAHFLFPSHFQQGTHTAFPALVFHTLPREMPSTASCLLPVMPEGSQTLRPPPSPPPPHRSVAARPAVSAAGDAGDGQRHRWAVLQPCPRLSRARAVRRGWPQPTGRGVWGGNYSERCHVLPGSGGW